MEKTRVFRGFGLIGLCATLGFLGCHNRPIFYMPLDAATPLKVRGGAMGFRSDKPWVMNSNGSYCSAIPSITQIDLLNVDPAPASTIKSVSFPILIAARKSDGTADPYSGISMSYGQSSQCPNGGVQLTTMNSSPVTDSGLGAPVYGFYSPTAGIDMKHEESSKEKNNRIRYKNSTTSCFTDPKKPFYDEDACEQMSGVTVNGVSYVCINGECDLSLHP